MKWLPAMLIGFMVLASCDESAEQYRAEVGYYAGEKEHWWFGSDTSREQCTNEAISRFNQLNHERPGRAFSWACLRVRGDRILGRVR